jgi:hypothetical protein
MIDTIVLNIPRANIQTLSNDYTRTWDLQARTNVYQKFVKNPPRTLKDGVYRPRFTGIRRSIGQGQIVEFLKVEFSAPKLIFGNNLDEAQDSDFPKLVDLLYDRLAEVGCIVSKEVIANATVAAFHPSKNICLSEGYTASFVSRELSKINLNKKFDFDKSSFRNNGQSLQAYTRAHALVIYDKVADLGKTKKRAIDKDQVPEQLTFFSRIKTDHPSLEILRIEIRLAQKKKMNGVMTRLGLPTNPTFQQVFKKDICQKIVRVYWDTAVEGENLFLFGVEKGPKELLRRLYRQNPKLRAKDAIYLVGLSALSLEQGGIRELRSILEKHQAQRSWYRIAEGLKLLNKSSSERSLHGWVWQVRKCLDEFKPYKLQPP